MEDHRHASPAPIHRYAVATAVATWLLLVAGSLVTSTDSGLAVPDWPLSYGTWFPPMVGGILYEHGHRMVAAVVGLMILGLTGWLHRAEPRRWVRRLGDVALASVLAQAVLGGLTVLLGLPPAISIAHACLGQAVFCLVVCVALATGPSWDRRDGPADEASRRTPWGLGMAVAILVAIQLVLGAVIRHTGAVVMSHLGGAFVVLGAGAALAWRLAPWRGRSVAGTWTWRLVGLVGAQVALGLAVFLHRGSLVLRTSHVAVGALVLAQAVALAWVLLRRAAPTTEALTTRSVGAPV